MFHIKNTPRVPDQGAAGDFFRFAQLTNRNERQDRYFQHLLWNGVDPVGCDITRADGVDGDPLAGAFLGERLREAYVAHLRGGIIRLADLTFLAIDRGNTDDPAKTSLAHAFDQPGGSC